MPGTERPIRQVALSDIKADLPRFLRLAKSQEIVITRRGKPAGVLFGFETEEDWFDYRLEHNPEFLRRVAQAREDKRRDKVFDSRRYPHEEARNPERHMGGTSFLAVGPRMVRF